jgi:hypothetical protein
MKAKIVHNPLPDLYNPEKECEINDDTWISKYFLIFYGIIFILVGIGSCIISATLGIEGIALLGSFGLGLIALGIMYIIIRNKF